MDDPHVNIFKSFACFKYSSLVWQTHGERNIKMTHKVGGESNDSWQERTPLKS